MEKKLEIFFNNLTTYVSTHKTETRWTPFFFALVRVLLLPSLKMTWVTESSNLRVTVAPSCSSSRLTDSERLSWPDRTSAKATTSDRWRYCFTANSHHSYMRPPWVYDVTSIININSYIHRLHGIHNQSPNMFNFMIYKHYILECCLLVQ